MTITWPAVLGSSSKAKVRHSQIPAVYPVVRVDVNHRCRIAPTQTTFRATSAEKNATFSDVPLATVIGAPNLIKKVVSAEKLTEEIPRQAPQRSQRFPPPDVSKCFEIPGFRVALAIASLPGMTSELCCKFLNQDTSSQLRGAVAGVTRVDSSVVELLTAEHARIGKP